MSGHGGTTVSCECSVQSHSPQEQLLATVRVVRVSRFTNMGPRKAHVLFARPACLEPRTIPPRTFRKKTVLKLLSARYSELEYCLAQDAQKAPDQVRGTVVARVATGEASEVRGPQRGEAFSGSHFLVTSSFLLLVVMALLLVATPLLLVAMAFTS